jgi:hypothetical protein
MSAPLAQLVVEVGVAPPIPNPSPIEGEGLFASGSLGVRAAACIEEPRLSASPNALGE